MSILSENIEPQIIMVGHMFDVENRTYKHGFSCFYNGTTQYRADYWQSLKGLFGFRQGHDAYVRQLEKYVVAALMTCYLSPDGIHVYDNRFNKLIRIVNKVYGLPMGTLEVELDLKNGIFRMWSKHQQFTLYNSIIEFRLTKPDIFRGIGWANESTHPRFNTLDRAYYNIKPQAIKTHMMCMERLLNYDVDNDILVQ